MRYKFRNQPIHFSDLLDDRGTAKAVSAVDSLYQQGVTKHNANQLQSRSK